MKSKFILVLLGVVFLSVQALATGINVYINDGAITDKDGSSLPNDQYHPYKVKLEFFHGAMPNPTTSSGKLSVDTGTQYSKIGSQHKYQLSSLNGGTLNVRAWKNDLSGNRQGNYYGKASGAVASGTTLPYDKTMSISTNYKADVPYAPGVGTISEALQRTGDSMDLTLTIPVTYSENGSDGKREITGRSLQITFPDGTSTTKTGSSITLTGAEAQQGTYSFVPIATNWYGSTQGPSESHTTLGIGGVGGPETISYTFKKPTDDLGINPISFPFATVSNPSAITTVKELVETINTTVGENIVAAIGWWDTENQQPAGYAFMYNSDTVNDFGQYVTAGTVPADPADVLLEKDKVFQVSVLKEAVVEMTGTR